MNMVFVATWFSNKSFLFWKVGLNNFTTNNLILFGCFILIVSDYIVIELFYSSDDTMHFSMSYMVRNMD